MKVHKPVKRILIRYDTKIPSMGQEQIGQALEALRLLRGEPEHNCCCCCPYCRKNR